MAFNYAKYAFTCSATVSIWFLINWLVSMLFFSLQPSSWRPELTSVRLLHLSCTPLKIMFHSLFLLLYFFFYVGNLYVLHPPCSIVVLFSGCKLQLNCLSFCFSCSPLTQFPTDSTLSLILSWCPSDSECLAWFNKHLCAGRSLARLKGSTVEV